MGAAAPRLWAYHACYRVVNGFRGAEVPALPADPAVTPPRSARERTLRGGRRLEAPSELVDLRPALKYTPASTPG